ncbi:MAG: bifunctional DNA-formamidopyrimidine glycosylase/DNA-(apurinic or apyrimidinic site) lyase [Fibrobacterota bacterium]|nr:bifunctional DNA-formamidopyrimidine glycosylase/DNA-(apurinic or apyrimidinic site) lyase [Fibrobacterota bacterium]
MPELPEVETIVRMLIPHVEGKRIEKAELRLGRMLLGMDPGNLPRALKGQAVERILRRGKYIVIELADCTLVIHLGMTGQLTHSPADYVENVGFVRTVTGLEKPKGVHPVDKHTHLILSLEGGERILFRDPRTFGKIFLVPDREWPRHPRLSILGEEPLTLRVKSFLKNNFPASSSRPIKALLLDQSFLAGVGNIYADEALFRSGIHPNALVRDLGVADRVRLLEAVKVVLRKGIRNSGTSFSDYRKPDGTEGSNQERLQVYGRGGQPCRRCRTLLRKSLVAQRGTVHCPACQGESVNKKVIAKIKARTSAPR